MKKFGRTIFLFLVIGIILFALYTCIVLIPENHIGILYSKFNNKLILKESSYNLVIEKIIPGNIVIKKYPVITQTADLLFSKNISLLDKDIELLKNRILIEYKIDLKAYKYLFDHYNSITDIISAVKQEFFFLFHEKLNEAIQQNRDLNTFYERNKEEILKEFNEKMMNKGILISSLKIVNLNMVPDVNYGRIKELVNKSLDYEEVFQMEIRKIELERSKLKQEAENEVEYLKIVGEYIKENPLILRYLMIKKVDKNDIIFVPSAEIGFDFSDSLKSGLIKKLEEEK
ncbi:MAG: hypothetical protein KKH98_11620 [Spirochaetes bacterium]|nr:hypothetical protein [Spirochaetota bacterium]